MTPTPATVLLVDDEPDLLMLLKEILEASFGHTEVLTAKSGKLALEILKERKVDVLMSDFKMPGMNGLELIRAALHAAPSTRRVLMTAYDVDEELAVEGSGVEVLFHKPVDPEMLVRTVRGFLRPGA